jgi:hypothetical protein
MDMDIETGRWLSLQKQLIINESNNKKTRIVFLCLV